MTSSGSRTSEQPALELIGRIYDAAFEPERLRDFLGAVAESTDSRVGAIFVQDLAARCGHYTITHGVDPADFEAYQEFADQNVFTMRSAADLVSGAVLAGNDYITDDEYRKSTYYNEYMRRVGVFYTVGCCVYREDALTGILTFARSPGKPPYGSDDLSFLSALMPHLQRCLSLQRRVAGLESELAASREALDQIEQAVVLLDQDARLRFANRSARRLLDQNDGLAITRGKLCAARSAEQARLGRLVHDAGLTTRGRGSGAGGWLSVSRPSLRRPFGLMVSPLPRDASALSLRASVAVLVWDPETRRCVPAEMLAQAYGLTPAEGRVAGLLGEGLDCRSCGERLGVSVETVRTHVKRIFSKTRTRGQSDLVRLLMAGPGRSGT